MRYIVTAEELSTHIVMVEAAKEDDAASEYLEGKFIADLGQTIDADTGLGLSVEEV